VLKKKVAWSNDLALGQRIEHVLSACPNVTARIVGDEGRTAFVKAVKNTRNYFTHYDPAGKAKAKTEPRDLYRLTVQLRAVLETAFLLELDFECSGIEAVLDRARRFEEINLQR
jgi:ApeA N-terminal domain 1